MAAADLLKGNLCGPLAYSFAWVQKLVMFSKA